jgi:hypothetical protein
VRKCDLCDMPAEHRLTQIYWDRDRPTKRDLHYCDGCYEQLHVRPSGYWINHCGGTVQEWLDQREEKNDSNDPMIGEMKNPGFYGRGYIP